jgi:Zn-finger protein
MNRKDRRDLIKKIIEENRLLTRIKNKLDDCPCYNGKRCHPELKDKKMICFSCYCPYYLKDREHPEGACSINSKYGKWFEYQDAKFQKKRIWECTDCVIYHTKKGVRRFLKTQPDQELEEISLLSPEELNMRFFKKFP